MKKNEFRVPSLSEADPEYKALFERKAALDLRLYNLVQEQDQLRRDLDGSPRVLFSTDVMELLGDVNPEQAAIIEKAKRLRAIPNEARSIETAIAELTRRISDRRTQASQMVQKLCRPVYASRVAAVCDALSAVKAARKAYDDMVDEFDSENVAWTGLGPLALNFLGDSRDGHIDRVIRDAREAGHVS